MRPNKLRGLLKSNKPTLSTHIHTTWPSVVEAVASAPAAFRVRVWHLMSGGYEPKGGVAAAGGRSCCLSSRRCPQSFHFESASPASRTAAKCAVFTGLVSNAFVGHHTG
jgi:hypothetical protein